MSNYPIPRAAYVHIPFCRRRCYYCDFPVAVVGDHKHGGNSVTIQEYIDFLSQEIINTRQSNQESNQSLATIFFGGGTPSLLSVSQLGRILDILDRHFGIDKMAEISIEMDPGTFDLEKVKSYRDLGINRVSLGVQAFQDELLKICGRTHTVNDIYDAVNFVRQANINNLSLDLISGLPHQTLSQWENSLTTALSLGPEHLSCYDLIVEQKTAFSRMYEAGVQPLPTDEISADMYRLSQRFLTQAGYKHYEISNYARSGYQSLHNRIYWERKPYYGFGMGAASYLGGERLTRPRKTGEYYQWVRSILLEKSPEIIDPESSRIVEGIASKTNSLLETLMLGLRLAEGLSISELTAEFGASTMEKILTCLRPFQTLGWVEIINSDERKNNLPENGRFRLTDPEGFLFSNTILASLFSQFDSENTIN